MPIQILDQNTINKIAAGEVIERPSSIVKELVENAIDAKATAITIEIKEGGISFIRITDNGCGIPEQEISKAFLRHSTSKIKSIEDLATVSSLGFRGEALSSIAAVSQVELITKCSESFSGYRYIIEGGKEVSTEAVGVPDGTTFIIRNLFYNTPVRRKFLKSAATEAGYINTLLEHLALSHTDISFRFINNNQNKLHTSGNNNLKDIIYHVYGREISAQLIPIHDKTQDIEITGFIGKPLISRGNRNYENYYINGRYIKSAIIFQAIEDAYKGFIMPRQYPFTAIHFTINPAILDVNVHPTKMELRFSVNEVVYNFVLNAVKKALTKRELIPDVKLDNVKLPVNTDIPPKKPDVFQQPLLQVRKAEPQKEEKQQAPRLPEPFEMKRSKELTKPQVLKEERVPYPAAPPKQIEFAETEKLLKKQNQVRHKLIGQLFETYWLIEFEEKLFIMDQHAAHEKVLYEKTMRLLNEKQMDTQMIIPPVILSLNIKEEQALKESMDIFTKLGYEIEEFGGKEYKVTGVPANLPSVNMNTLLLEVLDSLADEAFRANTDSILEKVASMSCKAAVKGNNRFTEAEAKALIGELLEAENPYNCPHGRPTLISMTKYELEKKFKRIV